MIRMIGLIGTDRIAEMDDADYQSLPGYRYYYDPTGYVMAVPPNGAFLRDGKRLHILLMGQQPRGVVVDHIDGNGLNNTRHNLRAVGHQSNQVNRKRLNRNNTSGIRGVYFVKKRAHMPTPWHASIMVGRKTINLGSFATKEEAAAARRHAELQHFGELCPTSKAS